MTSRKKPTAAKKRAGGAPMKGRTAAPKGKTATKTNPASKPASSRSQFFTPDGGPWGACFLPRAPGERRYWLVKSEPDVFSWDDLLAAANRTTRWDGVRNFAARNFLRDAMKRGDLVFYYHSMASPQSIVGICEVVREAYPDPTACDRAHDGYDPGSSAADPTWFMVDLRAVESLAAPVSLPQIKAATPLADMALLRVGRLSVSPVTTAEWDAIVAMGRG